MGGVSSQKRKARDKRGQPSYTIPTDYNERLYQSLWQEGHGLEKETLEEEIEYRVYANLECICKCVNVVEILPHLNFLEDTGTFRETRRRSIRDSVLLLIERLKKSKEPKKWQWFLRVLITKGYGHITNLILGQPESDYKSNKNALTMMAPHLKQRIDPDEIVDKLLAEGLISEEDSQEIRCEERCRGKIAASAMILQMVPRRLDNWFSIFMSILEGCGLNDITDQSQASGLSVEKYGTAKQRNQDIHNKNSHRKRMPLPHDDTTKDNIRQYPNENYVNTKGVRTDFDQYEKDIQKQDKEKHQHGKRSSARQKEARSIPHEETPKDIPHHATRTSNVYTRGVQTDFQRHQTEIRERDEEIQRLKNELECVNKEKSNSDHGHVSQQRPKVRNDSSGDGMMVMSALQELLSRTSSIDSKLENLTSAGIKSLNYKGEPCTPGHSKHSYDDYASHYDIYDDKQEYYEIDSSIVSEITTPVCVENDIIHEENNREFSEFSDDRHIYENLEQCIRSEMTTPSECEGKGKGLKSNYTYVDGYEVPEQCIGFDMATPNKFVEKHQIINRNAVNRAGVGDSSFNADDYTYYELELTRRNGCEDNRSINLEEDVYEVPDLHTIAVFSRQNGCATKAEIFDGHDDEVTGVDNLFFNADEECIGIDEPNYESI